jgi:hypothetical protein
VACAVGVGDSLPLAQTCLWHCEVVGVPRLRSAQVASALAAASRTVEFAVSVKYIICYCGSQSSSI